MGDNVPLGPDARVFPKGVLQIVQKIKQRRGFEGFLHMIGVARKNIKALRKIRRVPQIFRVAFKKTNVAAKNRFSRKCEVFNIDSIFNL